MRAPPSDDIGAQVHARIAQLLAAAGADPQLVEDLPLKRRRVRRQVWRVGDRRHAFVLKRFEPERACVERHAIERWLPRLGLADVAPVLFAVVAASDGQSVWHVYEDLGDATLDADDGAPSPRDRGFLATMATPADSARLEPVLAGLARLHDASAGHAILGECRYWTGDLGGHYLRASVHDAIAAVDALLAMRGAFSPAQVHVLEALLAALAGLSSEAAQRCAEIEAYGGGDCLLHGDFGVRNAMAVPAPAGWAARIIDWDHAGVGPASYDLSTLLLQLPQAQRVQALETYCAHRRGPADGWPTLATWNGLFDTAERSRFANMAIWPALWAQDGERDSAIDNLSAIVSWFDALQPVLPASAPLVGSAAHG